MHEGDLGGPKEDIGYLRAGVTGGGNLPKWVKVVKTSTAAGDFNLLAVSQADCKYLKMGQ